MTELKKKRVFSAVLSGLIMLSFILFTFLIYQIVGIVTRKNEIKLLDNQIKLLTEEIEQTESEIESWGYAWKIEQAARERLGYVYPNEEIYTDISGE